MKSTLLFISIVLFPFFVIAQDTIPPTPVLMDYGSIQLQGDSMSFPASFFNIGSYDNQTDSSDLKFAYSEDVSDSIKTIYCHNKYNIEFEVFVFDTSGNYASKEIENRFESQNCPDTVDALPPTPYCLNGVVTTFADSFGVNVPASIFNAGSFDDQTPDSLIKVSYSQDLSDTIIQVNCEDIGETQVVDIYFTDLTGNSDYCTSYLTVVDADDCQSNTEVVDSVDTIPPRLFILRGIVRINIPPSYNLVGVNAKDFVITAFDNVTLEENIKFSFSKDINDSMNYYTCAHEGTNFVDLYAYDEAGNWSKVPTYLIVNTFQGEECNYPEVDTVLPSIVCPTDTTRFYLESDSVAHVYVNEVIDTAYDDFTSYEEMFLSFDESYGNSYEEFGCDELGYHTFNFQASDLLLNSSICEATIEIIDTSGICQTTAVERQLKSEQLQIYPNPASDRINIRSSIRGNVLIIDALGREIYQQETKAHERLQLNCESWNSGVYTAILESTQSGRISTLFIIQ